MDLNDPCLQADGLCIVRLHVGGLGPSVISSDLVQIFSSLAEVSCVDLVRTKGRNFAYVTIQAAPREIKRLFSLYNGCIWKGGRLKLEKAREFYLDKLNREWADRDRVQDIQTPKLNFSTTATRAMKSKNSRSLKIYIPKLRKVKSIPEKGLGKHKHSFERVDPLPYSLLQVCNCDQHCTITSKYQSRTRNEALGMDVEEGLQGFNDFCFGKAKDLVEREICSGFKDQAQASVEEAQQVVEGVGSADRKRLKSGMDTWASKKKHFGETRKITASTAARGDTNEGKACKNSIGRSWFQKASWKSLVGEAGRMSFSLGSMLDQNLTGNPESTYKELVQPTVKRS